MPNEACPLPDLPSDDEGKIISRLLKIEWIVIVGLSDDPGRPSHQIGQYLLSHGKKIVPVNPLVAKVFGQKSYASLAEVPQPVELVNVFRRSEFCGGVVRDAIAAGAKAIWLQSGIRSSEAISLAKSAGIDFIEDRCIMVEHMRNLRTNR